MANEVASSKRTPNNSVSTSTATTCMPPPIPGICTAAPNETNPMKIRTSTNVEMRTAAKARARHQ